MTAKEYPENVVGQASVYRLNTHELTVEFSFSRQFKTEYLSYLKIGQGVRVPLYTTPPSVDALIAEAIKEHDAKNLLIKSVNMRTQAQPYLDELIAEIDELTTCAVVVDGIYTGEAYPEEELVQIIGKYRSAK
jgi:hypothetical protein